MPDVKEKTEEELEQAENEQEQQLVDKTELRLEKAFVEVDDEDDDIKKTDSTADDSDDSDKSTPEEKPADDAGEEEESTPDEKDKDDSGFKEDAESKAKDGDAEGSTDKTEVSGLSDAYHRAAIHRGWTNEEIKDFYEANPKLATKTFSKIYEAVNRSSREFAAFGRARREKPANNVTDKVTATEAQTQAKIPSIDIEKLRTEYPDESIAEVVQTLVNEIESLKTEVSKPAQIDPAISQESAAIQQQIEGFFKSDDLKGYDDFYGSMPKDAKDWQSLTPGESANRWAVISMMDEMLAGAELLGREMGIDEAMRLSHLCVTEKIREKVIREEIKSSATKRGNSISLKPSSTNKPEVTSPQTAKELELVTEERLKKAFNT